MPVAPRHNSRFEPTTCSLRSHAAALPPDRQPTPYSSRASVRIDQKVQQLTDRPLLADGFSQRQMSLDLVAIATAVLLLLFLQVSGFCQVTSNCGSCSPGDR